MKRFVRKVLLKLRILNPPRPKVAHRESVIISIQPNLEFEIYWKALDIGKGPAIILKAYAREIMKFDCFGKDKGHYHIAPHYGFRIYFLEEKAIDQIERTVEELRKNAQKYLSVQQDSEIRKLIIDQQRFELSVKKAEEKLKYFLYNIPELEELL